MRERISLVFTSTYGGETQKLVICWQVNIICIAKSIGQQLQTVGQKKWFAVGYIMIFFYYSSLNYISKTREKSMVIKERKMMSSFKNVNEDHYLMKVNIDQSVYFSCLNYLRLRNYNSIWLSYWYNECDRRTF